MLLYQGLRACGGTLGTFGSIKPGAYHFWGIIDSPCFCANKLRGSIGNLTCMSIGVARPECHARTRAGFPQKFGRWVNSMGKGELHTTERTFHQTINPMGTGGQARGGRRDLHSENNSRTRGRLILQHTIAGRCVRYAQRQRGQSTIAHISTSYLVSKCSNVNDQVIR